MKRECIRICCMQLKLQAGFYLSFYFLPGPPRTCLCRSRLPDSQKCVQSLSHPFGAILFPAFPVKFLDILQICCPPETSDKQGCGLSHLSYTKLATFTETLLNMGLLPSFLNQAASSSSETAGFHNQSYSTRSISPEPGGRGQPEARTHQTPIVLTRSSTVFYEWIFLNVSFIFDQFQSQPWNYCLWPFCLV